MITVVKFVPRKGSDELPVFNMKDVYLHVLHYNISYSFQEYRTTSSTSDVMENYKVSVHSFRLFTTLYASIIKCEGIIK